MNELQQNHEATAPEQTLELVTDPKPEGDIVLEVLGDGEVAVQVEDDFR